MKKLFLIIFLISLSAAYAQNYFEVEWREICPPRYVNIDVTKRYFTTSAQYWANRRVVFNNRVARCRAIMDPVDRSDCFEQLRALEMEATDVYNAQQQTERYIDAIKYSNPPPPPRDRR